jgi:hypothetical protein
MHMSSNALRFSRFSFALLFAAFLVLLAGQARAEEAVQKPVGPWVVAQAKDASNVGLIFYFSPDGTFGLIDPRTLIGAAGTFSVGRAGLMINVFNVGKSAEFIVGEMTMTGDTLTVDVKNSAFMDPQRIVLQRVKVIPPAPATLAPVPR